MTREQSIIELGSWLQTPPGAYLGAWEQSAFDDAVADAFGYHAVQLGLPGIDGLRTNRMPHRWVVDDAPPVGTGGAGDRGAVALHAEFDALPFPSASVDLALLPHTLEFAGDPHRTLREVDRVLVPEGRVVIVGLNPASLWGLRQHAGRLRRALGWRREQPLYLPSAGGFIGYRRLRDWLQLLGFEVETAHFGCWRPPLRSQRWLERSAGMDRLGDRWWPVLGAVYAVVAVKRVHGMRLVARRRPARRPLPALAGARVAGRLAPSDAAPARAVGVDA